jgi:hypothetical protein
MPKLAAEGTPDEQQIVLGWMLDTHLLLVELPADKLKAWVTDAIHFIRKQGCSQDEVDTLVGRLNHAAAIMPMSRHFLGRLRDRIDRNVSRQAPVLFAKKELKDLRLWQRLLTKASLGISMNLIVARSPSHVCWSDACPFGLGGYSLSGRA